jgi:flagellar biosynthesis protein FlhA
VGVDPLGVDVGYALVSLVDERQNGTLLTRVRAIRKQIANETGLIVPPVRIADNLQLGPRAYSILVKGVEVARGELYAERLLAINPGTVKKTFDGTPTREPAFGLPAVWISHEQRDAASAAGYTVVDATTALSTHLSETIRAFLPAREGDGRSGRADVATPGRGPRAEGRIARRDSARAAPAPARTRAGA